MQAFFAALAGLLFGLGLIVSGMTDPAKVRGFLDLAGAWNPSLMFVMGGALGVGLVAFAAAARRRTTLLGAPMQLPTPSPIDRRLLLGATTFGVGWGIAGFCPGPALASIASGRVEPLIFTAAMLAGMAVFALFERNPMQRIPT
jgi:uncharacterized membrane protein YedE/YeeE